MTAAFLFDVTIRISALLAIAWIVCTLLRRASAATRHTIWAAALGSSLLVPLFMLLTPALNAPVQLPVTTMRLVVNGSPSVGATIAWPWTDLLVAAWLAGALVQMTKLAAGFWRVARIIHRAHPEADGVRITGMAAAPMTFGAAVILPRAAENWPQDRLISVLAHERAHVRRLDWLWLALANAACALYWFHPLAWVGRNRMILESERACDDLVLETGVGAFSYATHLVELARERGVPCAAVAMARPSTLERRLAAMLSTHTNRRPVTRAAAILTSFVAVAAALTLAAVRAPAQAGPGSVSGTVYDASGRTIAGALVTIRTGGTSESTRTEGDGRFLFETVKSSEFELEVAKPGFAYSRSRTVVSGTAPVTLEVHLSLGRISESMTVQAEGSPRKPVSLREAEEAGGHVVPPKLLVRVEPTYPAAAKQRGSTGFVNLVTVVGTNGEPLSVSLLSPGADPDLAEAAMEAVRQWRYTPALLNGVPVEVIAEVKIEFRLQ